MRSLPRDLLLSVLSHYLVVAGMASVGLYIPIFLYEQFANSFLVVGAAFFAIYLGTALLFPLVARLSGKISFRTLMIIAVLPAMGGAVIALMLFPYYPILALIAFVIGNIVYRAFYWMPYNTLIARLTRDGERGSQLALLANAGEIIAMLAPALGGFAIALSGFENTFVLVLVIIFLGALPLFAVGKHYADYSLTYAGSLKLLFAKKQRLLLVSHAADGAQGVVSVIIWPLFLFVLLSGAYEEIGIIATVAIMAAFVARALIGKVADGPNAFPAHIFAVVLVALGWLSKAFVGTGLQAFITHTFHVTAGAAMRISSDTATFGRGAASRECADEYFVLYEYALGIGRALSVLACIFLVGAFGFAAAFVMAAFLSLFLVLIPKTHPLVPTGH